MRTACALNTSILLWFAPTFTGKVMPVDKAPAPKCNQGRQRRTYTSLAKVKRKSWLRSHGQSPSNDATTAPSIGVNAFAVDPTGAGGLFSGASLPWLREQPGA